MSEDPGPQRDWLHLKGDREVLLSLRQFLVGKDDEIKRVYEEAGLDTSHNFLSGLAEITKQMRNTKEWESPEHYGASRKPWYYSRTLLDAAYQIAIEKVRARAKNKR